MNYPAFSLPLHRIFVFFPAQIPDIEIKSKSFKKSYITMLYKRLEIENNSKIFLDC